MNLKKCLYFYLFAVLLTGLTLGCSTTTQYGKLGYPQTEEPKMTLDQLLKDWQDYNIYYSGVWEGHIYGVMFDPKNDDRELVGHEWWSPVETQEDLWQMVRLINVYTMEPQLWKIMSPDDQLHGYLYTLRHPVIVKVIDDQTLWVDDLTFPPLCETCDPGDRAN